MKFSELSKEVQDRVRYAEPCHEWWDGVYEDAKTCAELLGITFATRQAKLLNGKTWDDLCLWFSGFGDQGSGAAFEGYWEFKPDICEAIAQHAPQDQELAGIAQALCLLQTTTVLELGGRLHTVVDVRGNYSHSGAMTVEVTLDGDSEYVPEEVRKEAESLMRRFADWIFDQLSKENEYLSSDEYFSQYDFDEDGTII